MRPSLVIPSVFLITGCVTQTPPDMVQPWSVTIPNVAVVSDDLIRVVTPFAEPRVVTTSTASIERNQHVLYVLPSSKEPFNLFVTDALDETASISLGLTPEEDGVREVNLVALTEAVRTAPPSRDVPPDQTTDLGSAPSQPAPPWVRPCQRCRATDDYGDRDDATW